MKLLLDTNILLWAAADKLPASVEKYILDESNELYYSSASIWEIVIKRGLNRPDFDVSPHLLNKSLVENGYLQIPISVEHTLLTGTLPMIHKDPFDRLLISTALAEDLTIITIDENIQKYDVKWVW